MLLDDTAIIPGNIMTTVCTDPLRFAAAGRRHRRLFWSGPEQPAVVGVGAACSVGCGFPVRAVPWHAFCGGAWSGRVAWSGPPSKTVGAARQDAVLSIRGGAIDLAHSRVATSVRSACSATPCGLRLRAAGAAAGRRLQWLLQHQAAQQPRHHRRQRIGTNCAAGRQGRVHCPQLVACRARSRAQQWARARRGCDDRPEPLPQLRDRRIDPERHGHRKLGVFRPAFESDGARQLALL